MGTTSSDCVWHYLHMSLLVPALAATFLREPGYLRRTLSNVLENLLVGFCKAEGGGPSSRGFMSAPSKGLGPSCPRLAGLGSGLEVPWLTRLRVDPGWVCLLPADPKKGEHQHWLPAFLHLTCLCRRAQGQPNHPPQEICSRKQSPRARGNWERLGSRLPSGGPVSSLADRKRH